MNKNWQFAGIVLLLVLTISCKSSRKRRSDSFDSRVYSKKNFTEFTLDSVSLIYFFKDYHVSDSIQTEISEFYTKRGYQFAWFSGNRLTVPATNFYGQLKSYITDFADSSLHQGEIDQLFLEAKTDQKKFLKEKNRVLKLELLLTTAFFNYAQRAYSGTVENPLDLEWFIPRKKKDYQLLLDTIISSGKDYCIHEPVNQYYVLLKEKLRQYREIEKRGGWPKIVLSTKELRTGESDTAIIKIKRLLTLTGDFKLKDSTALFTDSLATAVVKFQQRMGLAENGKIEANTLAEMNQPVTDRIRQMMINMERLRWLPVDVEPNFILINIPEFKLHVFEQGKQLWDMNVVVGTAANRTTVFKGNMSQIIINPYWVIPTSIIKNEILPKLKKNPSYLQQNEMEVLSGNQLVDASSINWASYEEHVPFIIRQRPGKNNSLGKIKFLFPNSFDIYLHDTPAKSLFDETKRAFSHGCIRLAEPRKLAAYILKNNSSWPEEKFNDAFNSDKDQAITINPKVPVYIVYFTTWVDHSGRINFRKDIYGLDECLAEEIFE